MNEPTKLYRLIALLLAFIPLLVTGQRFINMGDEFPFPSIRNITQDEYGFLWISTIRGPVKYNGYEFIEYKPSAEPGKMKAQYAETIYADKKGGIWIGTKGNCGIEYYDRNKNTFTQLCFWDSSSQKCFDHIDVYAINEDQDGYFWVGSDRGIFKFLPYQQDTIVERYKNIREDTLTFSDARAMEIWVDKSNTVWIGSLNGLNRFDRERKVFINFRNNRNYLRGQILTIKENPEGELWVSGRHTADRIYRYLPEIDSFESVYQFADSLSTYFNFDFQQDGTCWIALRGDGAIQYQPEYNTAEFFPGARGEFHGLTDYRNQCVFVDSYDNVWVGGNGLFKLPSTRKKINSIKGNGYEVLDIHVEKDFVLYSLNEPFIWDKNTKISEPFRTFPLPRNERPSLERDFANPLIYEFGKRDERTLVFTTVRNVFEYDLITGTVKEYPQNRGGIFRDFEFGKNGDVMYIAEGNSYSLQFDFSTGIASFANQNNLAGALYTTTLAKDLLGYFWWGPNNGKIHKYDEDKDVLETFHLKLNNNDTLVKGTWILDILPHSDTTIWVGTENGFWHLSHDGIALERYGMEDGLPTNYIYSMLEDNAGNIWIGHGNGISKFDIENRLFTNYSESDGFINKRYTRESCTIDEDGTFYFGGPQGIDIFHPEEIKSNEFAPEVYVGNIKVNGKQYETDEAFENIDNIKLQYNQNYIDLDLLGLHLTTPNSNKYQYRINNRPWIDLGNNRTISLSNVSQGKYTITAKASNGDGVWSNAKSLINIKVMPPWWNTIWFYFLCTVVLALMLYTLYRYRIAQIQKREQLQTAFNKKIAEIEMKALRAQMNPHFIFNSLNSVKSLISQNDNQKASLYLTRFSQLIRLVLNNSRKKMVRLEDDLESLRLYLEIEQMRFGHKFDYDIIIGNNVNADFLEIPPLLIQPFVENAIWHGLMHKEDGQGKISIEIRRQNEMIHIAIEDNGIGRERALALQTRSKSKSESLGVQITEDRLKFLKEIYGSQAQLKILDLVDPAGTGIGTRVEISIPSPD